MFLPSLFGNLDFNFLRFPVSQAIQIFRRNYYIRPNNKVIFLKRVTFYQISPNFSEKIVPLIVIVVISPVPATTREGIKPSPTFH